MRALLIAVLSLGLASTSLAAEAPPVPSPAASPLAIARCIWAALPKATREALVATGPRIDDFMTAVDAMNDSLMQVARSQCPAIPDAERQAVSAAWPAVILTAWSEAQLQRRFGVTPAALEASWRRVGPDSRARLAADMDKTPSEARADLAGQSAELGLTTPDGQDLLVFWSMTQLKLAAMGG